MAKRAMTKTADTAQSATTVAKAMPAGLDPFAPLGLHGLQTLFSIRKEKL